MELLEEELNDPTSPRPPPLPPRPTVVNDTRNMSFPSLHSASAPAIIGTDAMWSRSHGNQSAPSVGEPSVGEERESANHEERYVSSPQVARPYKSAASAASHLRASARTHHLHRARTCEDTFTCLLYTSPSPRD